jgi:hypothetical protein
LVGVSETEERWILTLEAWRRNWRRWLRREDPGHPLAAATSIAPRSFTVSMVARGAGERQGLTTTATR